MRRSIVSPASWEYLLLRLMLVASLLMLEAHAVRGVGRKNADVELAQLADMLPAEDHSTNAAAPSLEKGGASTAPDPAAARASAEPPEPTEASSPGAPPAAAMRRQDRSDSPRLQRLVSHSKVCPKGCLLDSSVRTFKGLFLMIVQSTRLSSKAQAAIMSDCHYRSRPASPAPALRQSSRAGIVCAGGRDHQEPAQQSAAGGLPGGAPGRLFAPHAPACSLQ